MADVTGDDRAQLILISALVIAVIFVALALVVNSAIYTENLSTRESGGESRDVLEQRATTDFDVERAVDTANAKHPNTEDVTVIESELEEILDNHSTSLLLEHARFGKVANLQLNSTTEGSHLRQATDTRNMTAGGDNTGDPNWTLAKNATRDGTFRLGVRQESLLNASSDSVSHMLSETDQMILGGLLFHEAFHVEITTEGGDTWRTFMFQAPEFEDGTVYIYTEGPDEDVRTVNETLATIVGESCAAPVEGETAEIDFAASETGGEHCKDLAYYQDDVVGTNHTISYRNARTEGLNYSELEGLADHIDTNDDDMYEALSSILADTLGLSISEVTDELDEIRGETDFTGGDRAVGTYDVVVDTPAEEANFDDADGEDPTRRVLVYSARFDVTYRSGIASLDSTEVEVEWSGP